ncbi:unnamed protein product, partial [Medioppia subpectinata]
MAQQITQRMASLETTDDGEDNIQQPQMYAKNSMDRFGDDMCALILSYITFEDRFRYECVSKQFQRTVFESVVDIHIYNRLIEKILSGKTIDVQMLATIAIKCANIKTIDCRGIGYTYERHIPEVLNTFRDNCRHLRDICTKLVNDSSKSLQTFGSLVTEIGSFSPYHELIDCQRLSKMSTMRISDVFDTTSGRLLVKNLRRIELRTHSSDSKELLSAFVAHNQSLKSFTVDLINLRFDKPLTEINQNMAQQMKHLKTSLEIRDDGNEDNRQQNSMDRFGDNLCALLLSYLSLEDRFRLECVSKQFQRTVFLNVMSIHINEEFVNKLIENNTIDTKYLDNISRLPALQTLVIHCRYYNNCSDNDIENLFPERPKLKLIEIY